jgi:hypothetical protein
MIFATMAGMGAVVTVALIAATLKAASLIEKRPRWTGGLVPAAGVEPATYGLWDRRSNHLSYTGNKPYFSAAGYRSNTRAKPAFPAES